MPADRPSDPHAATDRLVSTLSDLADGLISPRDARANLRGTEPPNEPARMVKHGRWAVDGGYPSGVEGARLAARDALDQLEYP